MSSSRFNENAALVLLTAEHDGASHQGIRANESFLWDRYHLLACTPSILESNTLEHVGKTYRIQVL